MSTEYLLVTDVEDTGGDPADLLSSLLEVGLILVDTSTLDLVEVGRGSSIVRPPGDRAQLDRMWAEMIPVVRDMHTTNGLWYEATTGPADMTPHAWELDEQLVAWLNGLVGPGAKVTLAGSGVGHHDHRWLHVHLPKLTARLHYSNIDASSFRRMLMLAGRADLVRQEKDVDAKPHRALADAELHAEELRYYLQLLWGVAAPPED